MSMHTHFDILWQTWQTPLRRYVIGFTRDLELAEDVLQETYLLAHRGYAGFRGEEPLAWLAAIARNAALVQLRRQSARPTAPIDALIEMPAPVSDPALCIALHAAITALPTPLRQAFIMKHFGGYTYMEIARRLACPVGTIKWRVSAALNRLQVALALTKGEHSMPHLKQREHVSALLVLNCISDR